MQTAHFLFSELISSSHALMVKEFNSQGYNVLPCSIIPISSWYGDEIFWWKFIPHLSTGSTPGTTSVKRKSYRGNSTTYWACNPSCMLHACSTIDLSWLPRFLAWTVILIHVAIKSTASNAQAETSQSGDDAARLRWQRQCIFLKDCMSCVSLPCSESHQCVYVIQL